jgi:NADH dehydrogenase
VRLLKGKEPKPFKYFNFGALVSVGEHYAAVNLLGIKISGFIGWLIWRTLYLSKIIGMSNRIRIVTDWTLDLLIERSITQFRTEEFKNLSPINLVPRPMESAVPTSIVSDVSKS